MAFLRFSARLSASRLTIRHASNWTHSPPFFQRARFPPILRPHIFWVFPLAGGIALYFSPQPSISPSYILSSPTIIPTPSPREHYPIQSPSEPHRPILSRILALLTEKIWEPILTATRFVHLFLLFLPVFVMAPMLLVGQPVKELHGDRWGAIWWYGWLVRQMEAAGPTFTKVCSSFPPF
jgi:aarF domain-containing kinase